jgi:asparagine synthase (glutamine-hydrolysing)
MCGFAGVVAWDDRYRTSRETLARMSAAIAHRGPDGEGSFFNHEDQVTAERPQCALAFRRLAILDPDPRSSQPFTIGNKTLVFNGEIYNYRDLRKELSAIRPDYSWRTTGDTEVLLMAYDVWADKCVEHLNGMFAFAIWDEAERSLFLARDRMGQKPLYIAAISCGKCIYPCSLGIDQGASFDVIGFASEPSAIGAMGWLQPGVDPNSISEYLRFGVTPGTVFASMHCIGPCETLTLKHSAADSAHSFTFSSRQMTDSEAVGQTRKLVSQAVERQLVSDVPLGIFLSGGIDSAVIAACARRFGPVETFSIGFDDPRYDETPYGAAVAKHLGTNHHIFRVTPRAADDLPKLAAVFGTPFGDSSALPTHYLARETRAFVKVALSGDGGDELFGGYDRYRALRIARWLRPMAPLHGLGEQVRGGHPKSRSARIGRLISSLGLPPGQRYESYLRIFDEPALIGLLRTPSSDMPNSTRAKFFDKVAKKRGEVHAAMLVDRTTYLPDDLLTKVDRCSMLHGLEVRSPFLDHELVQFAAGLTTDQLLKGGPKRMLREAFAAELPDFVFKRKKMGFAVPIGEWFRGELRSMLRDHLFASDSFASQHFNRAVVERLVGEHEQSRVDHSQRLYAMLMLELWWKNRGVGLV